MMIMVQTGKKNLSQMKEKLYKMRMEIKELEDAIDDCENTRGDYNEDYDRDRERSRYREDDERYHDRDDYGHRERYGRGRY